MRSLKCNVNGQTRHFLPNGEVALMESGSPVVKGKWRAQAQGTEAQANEIRYTFNGAAQPPVPIKYSFNKTNQLVAVIPAAANNGADSEPCNWAGEILIDDTHDLIYSLISEAGTPTGQQITVYGDLRFEEETCDLIIDLKGGGQGKIKGIKGPSGVSQLLALENFEQAFDANDLLQFVAITKNDLPGGEKRLAARIAFQGKWDINPDTNQLVFMSKVANDGNNREVMIGFAGRLKAVTAGFAFFADKNGTKLAFEINGRHEFDHGQASWQLTLGHSKKAFSATFAGKIQKATPTGQTFELSGLMAIKKTTGAPLQLDFQVAGEYAFDERKRLIFSAKVSSGPSGISYDLRLAGTFVYRSGKLSFQVQFAGTPDKQELRLELAFQSNSGALRTALSLVLDRKENQVRFNFEFTLQMTFIGGELVKGAPQPLPPQNG